MTLKTGVRSCRRCQTKLGLDVALRFEILVLTVRQGKLQVETTLIPTISGTTRVNHLTSLALSTPPGV